MLQESYQKTGSNVLPDAETPLLDLTADASLLPGDSVDEKPKILLMGLRRSGKSSIQKVVFSKMAPNETLFLESTHKVEKSDVSDCSFIRFQIWDFPGHINFCDAMYQSDVIFSSSCAIIFVIDAQDDYHEALNRLYMTLDTAFRFNINVKFEVFIHKVDCLNDDRKIDIHRDITQRVMSAIEDLSCDQSSGSAIHTGFHLTSIYDHSIFEAFSKVVQRLIPCMSAFEELLDIFITNSMADKAFLFDVSSKIYLATDSSVVDMQTYELCCDMIDVVVDVASIYTPRPDLEDPAFCEKTGATVMLNTDTVLYVRGINRYMALVCLMPEDSLEKLGLIEYNFQIIKTGLTKLLEVSQQQVRDDHVAYLTKHPRQGNHLPPLLGRAAADQMNHLSDRGSVDDDDDAEGEEEVDAEVEETDAQRDNR